MVFVPTRLMAGEQRGGRERGKADPIDTLAVARAALRKDAHLQSARLHEQVLEVRRLPDNRADPDDEPATLTRPSGRPAVDRAAVLPPGAGRIAVA